jgi:integrase
VWVDGQRLAPATLASYRKNIRLHIDPYLGATRVDRLTATAVDAWMRQLEAARRADGQGGLSACTVRYVFTILRAALADAVKQGRLARNTDRSSPLSPSQARPPEMHAWTAPELARFLRWADEHDCDAGMGGRLLSFTGMRRGQALALRWRDVDLDVKRIAVWRSVGVVKTRGEGERLTEGATKTGQSRVVDLEPARWQLYAPTGQCAAPWRSTLSVRPRWCSATLRVGTVTLSGSRAASSRTSPRARAVFGEDQLPVIRLHDLRHTHATLLLAAGEPVKVVSERLGHANATITLTVYQHVHPAWAGRQPTASPRCSTADAGDQPRSFTAVSRGPFRHGQDNTFGS